MSGALGLSPPQEDKAAGPLFVEKLVQAGIIKKKQFTISLSPTATPNERSHTSYVTFGGLPENAQVDKIFCHDVPKNKGYWIVNLTGMNYNQKKLVLPKLSGKRTTIFDTGSTIV